MFTKSQFDIATRIVDGFFISWEQNDTMRGRIALRVEDVHLADVAVWTDMS
jgi:hypothetical protein